MGVYWLEAEETAAVSIVRSDNRGVADWPSLSMPGFQEEELAALWDVLQGPPGSDDDATGDPLASDAVQGTSVARVNPEFVRRLAALEEPGIERVTKEWVKFERFAGWPREGAGVVLRELASFARCAWEEGTAVLQVTDDR